MEHIILNDIKPSVKEFLAMPAGIKKNFRYTELTNEHTYKQDILYKDGCMYYGFNTYTLSRSRNGFFLKATARQGFTLNQKGKVSFWYGSSVKKLSGTLTLLKHLGHDWFKDEYIIFLTKGLFEKLLTKKITNPMGYFEAWLKAQRIKASPRLLFKATQKHNITQLYTMMLKYSTVIEHMDQFLIRYMDTERTLTADFLDLLDQAIILEVKIDPKWSDRRIQEEHQKMTRQIMDIKIDDLNTTPISQLDNLQKLVESPYIKLLDNERDVYIEGKTMNHCIYTNYWKRIEERSILCLHVDYEGQTGTLTLTKSRPDKGYKIYDFRSYRNQEPAEIAKVHVDQWLNKFNERVIANKAIVEPLAVNSVNDFENMWHEERHPLPF